MGLESIIAMNQAEANAEAQADLMRYNQRLAENEALRIEAENRENVRRQREESAELRASQIAMLGKSGAALSSGSPLAVLGKTAKDEELKAQDMHYQGYMQTQQKRNEANMYKYRASVAKASAPTGLAKSLNIAGGIVSDFNKGIQFAENAGKIFGAFF